MLCALCLALLVSSTALQVKNAEKPLVNKTYDTKPKSATPEGIELLWQRPHGAPKGILLYLHGCHGRATGMWTTDGPDGFHFDVCDTTKKKVCAGNVEESLLRQKARKKGYVVAAVSGGIGNPRGCMNTNDVPRVQLAMQYLVEQEPDLKDKPVIMTGHSSGGRVLPELVATGAGIANAKCIVPVADEIRVKGDSAAPLGLTPNYPEDVNVFMIHMERDQSREENVQRNLHQIREKGVRAGDLKLPYATPVTPEFFQAEGYGLDKDTSTKMYKSLESAGLIDEHKVLVRNPYAVGQNWHQAFKKANLIEKAGGYLTIQQYMDALWSEHWMAAGRYLDSILGFCNQPGFTKNHAGGNPRTTDLKAKVREIDQKAAKWKEELDKSKKAAKPAHFKSKGGNEKGLQMGGIKPKKK